MIAEFPLHGEPPRGGPQVVVRRLVPELAQQGVDVLVVAPDPSGSSTREVALEEGGTLITVPAGSRWTLARQLQPWRRNVQAALSGRGADLVHGQGLLPGGIAAADVKGVPVVVTAHGNARADTRNEYAGFGGRARAYLRNHLAGRAVDCADVVIGVSPDWSVNLPRQPKRFVYIPNMVDEEFFLQHAAPERGRVLFAGGGRRAIKGWALLAEAWPAVCEQVPEARLHVVGWPEGEELSPDVPTLYRHTVTTDPWLAPPDLAASMAQAAAVVIPSQFEVAPIVLAEAWCVGVPVVAVPVGGIPALATGAALLVERRPETLAAGIVAALRSDGVDAVVAEGRRRAEQHRPDAVVAAHVGLYDELVTGVRTL
jgi:glycosyltransferase involved in cell wall biosynthesis